MTTFTSPFTGTTIQPTDVSYLSVGLSDGDVVLQWSVNGAPDNNAAARIMDLNSSVPGRTLFMPPNRQVSVGQDALLNNVGTNTVTVKDSEGFVITTVVPGESVYIYLTNSFGGSGAWNQIQFGAISSTVDAAAVSGLGLTVIGALLNAAHPVIEYSTSQAISTGSRAKLLVWTGGSGTFTFAAAATLADNWFALVRNSGTGTLTLDASGGEFIDGVLSVNLQPGDSCFVVCSGVGLSTVGLGRVSNFNFTQNTKALVSGPYTLTNIEAQNAIQKFTGALAGSATVTLPATIAVYYVSNDTTDGGAGYTVTFTTGGGATVLTQPGDQTILICDSVNVYAANTGNFTVDGGVF